MAAGPMAPLAADGMVGGLGTGLVEDGVEVRRVAEEAAPHAVAFEHLGPEVFLPVPRLERQARGAVPPRAARRLIVRHPDHAGTSLVVTADEGREVIERAEGVIDDRLLDPPV